jgi:hypothetical protein
MAFRTGLKSQTLDNVWDGTRSQQQGPCSLVPAGRNSKLQLVASEQTSGVIPFQASKFHLWPRRPKLPRQHRNDPCRCRGCAANRRGINRVRKSILRQVEQFVAADQRNVTPAGAMQVPRLTRRYQFARR